jgi:hypothetical protein
MTIFSGWILFCQKKARIGKKSAKIFFCTWYVCKLYNKRDSLHYITKAGMCIHTLSFLHTGVDDVQSTYDVARTIRVDKTMDCGVRRLRSLGSYGTCLFDRVRSLPSL